MKPAALTSHLSQALHDTCPEGVPRALGLAVSGGGDSMALLRAGADWARRRRAAVFVATVDHGLRPEAAAEARFVAETCATLDLPHQILRPAAPPGSDGGNLQAEARSARYALLVDWAQDLEIGHIAVAHTMDDQAETVLLRLARGSGVDGLAAMSARRDHDGIAWLRPFLQLRRAALRDALGGWDQGWVDDPSNEDTRFDRIKARQALTHLAPLGLDVPRLSRTAQIMADARAALAHTAHMLAEQACSFDGGDVLIAREPFAAAPFDIRARLLAYAMGFVASHGYRPRLRSLQAVMAQLEAGRTQTLHGCLLSASQTHLRVAREPAAVADLVAQAPGAWDTRWTMRCDNEIDASDPFEIRAIGEARVLSLDDPQRGDLPRASRAALPGIWQGETLIAAPLPDQSDGAWALTLEKGLNDFLFGLLGD